MAPRDNVFVTKGPAHDASEVNTLALDDKVWKSAPGAGTFASVPIAEATSVPRRAASHELAFMKKMGRLLTQIGVNNKVLEGDLPFKAMDGSTVQGTVTSRTRKPQMPRRSDGRASVYSATTQAAQRRRTSFKKQRDAEIQAKAKKWRAEGRRASLAGLPGLGPDGLPKPAKRSGLKGGRTSKDDDGQDREVRFGNGTPPPAI